MTEALDAAAALAVRDLAQRIRSGEVDPHHQAALAQLVEAYLTHHPAESMPQGVAQAVASSFEGLWQPVGEPVSEPPPFIRDVIRDQFHRLYYHVSKRTWKDTWYRGVRTYKCPTDMWIYMELIDELAPGLVIETGTYRGGSALYIADRLETIGAGNVVTVDVNEPPHPPQHPRLTYLTGSSSDPEIVAKIAGMIPEGSPVLVILDSDHSRDHVLAELEAYAPLVPVGSYLIVEDTNVNGHPGGAGLRSRADGGDVGLHGDRPRLRGRRPLRALLPHAEPVGIPQARALTLSRRPLEGHAAGQQCRRTGAAVGTQQVDRSAAGAAWSTTAGCCGSSCSRGAGCHRRPGSIGPVPLSAGGVPTEVTVRLADDRLVEGGRAGHAGLHDATVDHVGVGRVAGGAGELDRVGDQVAAGGLRSGAPG